MSAKAKVLVLYYSLYGHVHRLAQEVVKGAEETGALVTLKQIPETLSKEVLELMHAPPKADVPVATPAELPDYDAIIFGCGTRFGQPAAQYKAFWDATGGLWAKGALTNKVGSFFTSSGTPGGGIETTALTQVSHFVHHGMIFVPLGYGNPDLVRFDKVHAGSPWGASTFAGADGSLSPNDIELSLAHYQGKRVAEVANQFVSGKKSA
jgi:NAD(P)H dehydrogenase (quinone)